MAKASAAGAAIALAAAIAGSALAAGIATGAAIETPEPPVPVTRPASDETPVLTTIQSNPTTAREGYLGPLTAE